MQFGDVNLAESFWSKCIPEPNTGCWLWLGALSSNARPVLSKGDRNVHAYRVAFDAARGSIAQGRDLARRCGSFCCVNPRHFIPLARGAINRIRARESVKKCKSGHAFTPENTYYRHGGGRICRACSAARGQQLTDKQKQQKRETGKRYRLWQRFGLTPEAYDALVAAQDGRCPICEVSLAQTTPHVDHDHQTGAVRGVLCMRCNNGLGALNDNADQLRRAAAYLERSRRAS